MGTHVLAIKDMAGLCKPYAAAKLVKTLKEEIGIPVHFHTHDTAGVQAGAILGNLQGLVAAREAQASILADSEPLRTGLQNLQNALSGSSGIGALPLLLLVP